MCLWERGLEVRMVVAAVDVVSGLVGVSDRLGKAELYVRDPRPLENDSSLQSTSSV